MRLRQQPILRHYKTVAIKQRQTVPMHRKVIQILALHLKQRHQFQILGTTRLISLHYQHQGHNTLMVGIKFLRLRWFKSKRVKPSIRLVCIFIFKRVTHNEWLFLASKNKKTILVLFMFIGTFNGGPFK